MIWLKCGVQLIFVVAISLM